MRTLLLLLLGLIPLNIYAQKKLPLIKATSKNAFIAEGNEEKSGWTLSPQARPDLYIISKSVRAQWVTLYTNIDSIKVKLKPGQHFDFIVLLNEKDSCFTRFESPVLADFSGLKPAIHDTIPFVLTAFNNILVKVIADNSDTLNLMFDSGTTDFLLTEDAIKDKLHSKNADSHRFQLSTQYWDGQTIYPVKLSGQESDGRFGWNLFDGKIVEIDFDKSLFIIHSKIGKISRDYEKFDIEYVSSLVCFQAELQVKNQKFKGRFLFDNGYQRTLMLDEDLMNEQHYPNDSLEVIKKVIMKTGQGREIPVLTVNNEGWNLGKYALRDIPVQLLSSGNPAKFKTHIAGNEVLKRFNTILDFQKNKLYLKPNGLTDLPYVDGKKEG